MFDYNNIKENEIFIGDIYIVTEVDKEQYYINKHLKKEDFLDACEYKLYKKDTMLLKVNDDSYVDIDSIKRKTDCEYIEHCLNIGLIDNIILKSGIKTPYVGYLFLKNIKEHYIRENNIHILELKLINNQK